MTKEELDVIITEACLCVISHGLKEPDHKPGKAIMYTPVQFHDILESDLYGQLNKNHPKLLRPSGTDQDQYRLGYLDAIATVQKAVNEAAYDKNGWHN